MAGALLRSGTLREFHPLGAVGNPVFSAASQLRAAIRRHVGADIADLFAIPRQHDSSDTIDWYAPEAGDVVPWSAATDGQRAAARAALLAARDRVLEHSRNLQAHGDAERQVFGRLLALVTQIPSDDHIYLVGDRPVLTFWGFHPLGAPPDFDVIGGLDAGSKAPVLPSAPVPPTTTVAPDAPMVAAARSGWRWWQWALALLLPLLLLLLLLPLLLRACGAPVPPFMPLPFDAATPTPAAARPVATPGVAGEGFGTDAGRSGGAPAAGGSTTSPAATAAPGAAPADTPPEQAPPAASPGASSPTRGASPAESPGPPSPPARSPLASPAATAATAPSPAASEGAIPPSPPPPAGGQSAPSEPPPGAPLTIPDQAVRENSTDFLNGRWRSITGLQDLKGNPVDLSYDFKNGQGTVSLRRSIGGRDEECTGRVGSTLKDGTLSIDQSGVRCPSGTTFQDAKVQCRVGAGGQAVCEGVNSSGSTYDVKIMK